MTKKEPVFTYKCYFLTYFKTRLKNVHRGNYIINNFVSEYIIKSDWTKTIKLNQT